MRQPARADVSLTQLRYFVAAAELGSMTWAADELFVAQSAVSTSIANLEAAVGVQLLIRRRAKGLQLTPQGAQFLQRARGILAAVDDAVMALKPENTAGRIVIGCFQTLAPFYLPPIISGLEDAYPELQVDVSELTADRIEEALLDQSIEIALTYDLGLGPDIDREVLSQVPLYAAVSSDHPLAGQETVSLSQLVDEPMVLLDLPASRDYFLQAFADQGLRPSVRYRFTNFEAVRAMVASGHGFTLLNQQPKLGHTYAGTELHRLGIRESTRPLDLVLARRSAGTRVTRKAEIFAEECRRAVAALAGPPVDVAAQSAR
ncbi:LysR substrate-binding domain-containing protein [Microbacterium sp. zg.Y1090]|uniref:LysR substrate-binding domain-containing protein n=1 Tax=Microbacterium TaxID=33882 RepID=UPI00214C8DC6|nr:MULTISPECIES: LysR substrate-binding domain-containing protein [unclassified Microbacterium]MCR2812718.1 LysR substrate-binding domain-containing protein [Microbacterium sp. zg.Y1084]MCR2817488.1 LysR substrate-binding domain-containing protein [Microbacterium sp. zg.Y1090]MDL5485870.1 LysR substrate-binding domain-containing protein [Microbacterium sp. zg-Y1211]WIM29029.1 LysR substrate-binding domain-containing protein [Microbacterium sp. zg-Y1090]